MSTAHDRLVTALEAHGARRHGNDWTCPAHDDRKPSLGVKDAGDRVLLHCQAGCEPDAILTALGLTTRDLFDEEPRARVAKRITAVYPYLDEDHQLLYEVVRFSPKDFRQRRPDGRGGDVWNLNGTRRVLYRLPKVLLAARQGKRIYVVEGEKDVEEIEAVGGVATCNPGGAGKWRDEYAEFLRGAEVVVVADRDEPGRKHARQVVESLIPRGIAVELVEPAEGKDAADHLAAGHGLEDFLLTPVSKSDAEVEGSDVTSRPSTNGTVRAVDVHPIKIDWLWQDRIPRGMVTVFTGPPKVGKSTILYDIAARASREGQHVLIATAEDHLAAVVRPRLEAAGADLNLIDCVTDPITLPDDVERIKGWIEQFGSVMVMVDPLVAFIADTVNTHRDHHVRRVLAPLADIAECTGAAIITVVHSNKGMTSDPLARVSGSVGFTGAARSIVVAADDPQDDSRKIFGVAGTNLAETAPALAYRVIGVELADEIRTSKIEWLGEAPEVDVHELLARRDPEERSAREEAIEFLRTSGAMDAAQPVKELEADAIGRGITAKTLQRARRALRLPVSRPEFGGPYYWGPMPDTHAGQPHPVQHVHHGDDLQEQGVETHMLDTQMGLGEAPEPGYLKIQREHGETPPKTDTEALVNIARVFPQVRLIGGLGA